MIEMRYRAGLYAAAEASGGRSLAGGIAGAICIVGMMNGVERDEVSQT